MDIDWSKAPEWATHYCKMAAGFRGHGDSLCSYCIPRPPQKAQEVEWDGEGLPPVGCECEINPHGEWFKAIVHGYGKNKFLAEISSFQTDSDGDVISGEHAYWTERTKFRPIRTKEQRLRDELGILIIKSDTGQGDARPIVDAILARYNLEPKP